MKPISYSHFLHLELGFLGGLEIFLFSKLKNEQWKDFTEFVERAENWLYSQNILEGEGN